MSTHLLQWDVRVDRRWSPLWTLKSERYDQEPVPPVGVYVNVTFNDDKAAREFEGKVRDLLEEAA